MIRHHPLCVYPPIYLIHYTANDQAPPPVCLSSNLYTWWNLSDFLLCICIQWISDWHFKISQSSSWKAGSSILQSVNLNQPIQITKNLRFWWKFPVLNCPECWRGFGCKTNPFSQPLCLPTCTFTLTPPPSHSIYMYIYIIFSYVSV